MVVAAVVNITVIDDTLEQGDKSQKRDLGKNTNVSRGGRFVFSVFIRRSHRRKGNGVLRFPEFEGPASA